MPTLELDGASIAYTDTGLPPGKKAAETIVFGHGLLFSGWMFSAQIEALKDNYRCIAIDWRGQGASPKVRAGYDMDTLSRDAIALIEQLDLAPVHYVGLSMGGFVGQRIAARRPDLVRSLTLLDTSAEREAVPNFIQDLALANIYRLAGMGPVRSQVEKVMFGPTFRNDPKSKAIIDEWLAMLAKTDRGAIRSAVMGVITRKGVLEEIRDIAAPTLVIVGADDVPTPVSRARTIAGAIKDARLEIVPDSGHSSTIEQPAAITALLSDFIGQHST